MVTSESSCLIIYQLVPNFCIVLKQFLPDIVQLQLFCADLKVLVVSKTESSCLCVQARLLPAGAVLFQLQFPVSFVKPLCFTIDQHWLVGLAFEAGQPAIFVYDAETGKAMQEFCAPGIKDEL